MKRKLVKLLKMLDSMVSEVDIILTPDGGTIRGMDPTKSLFVQASIPFIKGKEKLTLDLKEFTKFLSRWNKEEDASIVFKENEVELVFTNAGRKRTFKMPTLETSETPEVDLSKLQFSVDVELETELFKTVIKDIETIKGDVLTFKFENDTLYMLGEGFLNPYVFSMGLKTDENFQSKYGIAYLKNVFKNAFFDTFRVLLSKDNPVMFVFEDEDVKVESILAPRLEIEDVEEFEDL